MRAVYTPSQSSFGTFGRNDDKDDGKPSDVIRLCKAREPILRWMHVGIQYILTKRANRR